MHIHLRLLVLGISRSHLIRHLPGCIARALQLSSRLVPCLSLSPPPGRRRLARTPPPPQPAAGLCGTTATGLQSMVRDTQQRPNKLTRSDLEAASASPEPPLRENSSWICCPPWQLAR
ncbi:hypothetical protein IF1G_02736 [Cordyceps javanica]|uniref:Uncharacterized protein n=1 Tax=Cordyceps javanica TaxID=43265 RepID=A0A545VA94_9HYPO|nr:hypothetical protein IF1G_02736 [Cordyceps javanica]TQW09874.1 hypothetical protein IF2G_02664 [Cordyceps javanica]